MIEGVCVTMLRTRAVIPLVPVIAAVIFSTAGRAEVVSWVQGQTCPSAWSIEPARPGDSDVIQFSGPVRLYLNLCVAENALGGKPILTVDHTYGTIELRFSPPATSGCTVFWSPVCGLKGTLGPLAPGRWRFFCNADKARFSLEFTVAGDGAIQAIYYVDPNALGLRDGSSWKNALSSLQDALMLAGEGTEIRVAHGIYRPDVGADVKRGDQTATFQLKKGVVLKGGYAGWLSVSPNDRNFLAYETILSGDLFRDDKPLSRMSDITVAFDRLDNCYHVVTTSGTDSTAVLDGFTITGGVAGDSELPEDLSGGGGIYNDTGDATIRNCLIIGNGAVSYGGGFYSRGKCTPVLIDCTIVNNWTDWAGGGVYYHWGSDLIMSRCIITSNGAEFQGAGICSHSAGQLLMSNSIISGNQATDSEWSRGGGLYGSVANAHVNHCTFVGNVAAAGSAVACDLFSPSDASEIHLSNCILWGDGPLIEVESQSLVEITYSDVRGGRPGEGNIDADPCLVQMGSWSDAGTASDPCDDTWTDGDYHLRWTSPCMDAGSLDAVWEPNGTDLGGQPRVSGVTADMGAYELRNDPPVANAGPDPMGFTLDKSLKAAVVLDGGKSRDPEGLPLQFRWYAGEELISEQARFTRELSIGSYTYKLVVSDLTGQIASDEATATVTLVVGTKMFVSPQKMQRNSSQDVMALAILPKGKLPKDFDAAEPMLLFPGGIRAVKQSAFVWLSGDTLVLGTFKRSDLMAAVPTNGRTELRVVGRLKNGQYFSATDYATIE
jgi:hypothetical protein